MKRPIPVSAPGPFRADQLRSKDPYELHQGHPIRVSPTGGQGSGANLVGGAVILSDPAVQNAGVDAGFTPNPGTLRAPDVAVLPVNPGPGWVPGVPPLAVEYAGPGQDEARLHEKIDDLLQNGTRLVWVVRMGAIPFVEVWRPDAEPTIARAGEELSAPGVLANPVPVEALWSKDASERVILRNMLQRFGYRDLDEVREEGREEGREAGRAEGREAGRAEGREAGRAEGREAGREEGSTASLRAAVRVAAGSLTGEQEARLLAEADVAVLTSWVIAAARGRAWG